MAGYDAEEWPFVPLVFGPLQSGPVPVEGLCERSSGLCYYMYRCAGLGYHIRKIISKWGQLWTGPSAWSQLIGLISYEADVYSALWVLKMIHVPYGHTYRLAKGKDHARERVSSSDLECPLVHDCL